MSDGCRPSDDSGMKMSAQDVIMGARVGRLRELKAEIARLKAENAALRGERDALKAHFDMALLAAEDLRGGEPLEIWDGWNLVLGAQKEAKDRDDLIARAKASGKRVWIVFDGHDENVWFADGDSGRGEDARVRVSYTGGRGEHRADRFIVDFVRMAAYLGLADRVTVRTHDGDFLREVSRLLAGRA